MKTNYLKSRHIGLNEKEQQHMLQTIGVKTIDELIAQTMPSDILLDEPLDLDEALTEQEHLATMHQMAAKNQSPWTPPAKAMITKINTKIRETPQSPDAAMFNPTNRII